MPDQTDESTDAVSQAYYVWVELKNKSDLTGDMADARATGKAWARFLELFLPNPPAPQAAEEPQSIMFRIKAGGSTRCELLLCVSGVFCLAKDEIDGPNSLNPSQPMDR